MDKIIKENVLSAQELEELLNPLKSEDREKIMTSLSFVGFLTSLIDYKMRVMTYISTGKVDEQVRFNSRFDNDFMRVASTIKIDAIQENFEVLREFARDTYYPKEVRLYYLKQAFNQMNFWIRFFSRTEDIDVKDFMEQINQVLVESGAVDMTANDFLEILNTEAKDDLRIKIDFLKKLKKALKDYIDDLNSPLNIITGFMYANIKSIFDAYGFKNLKM